MIELQKRSGTDDAEPILRITGVNLTGPPCAATQAILDGIANFRVADW